MGKNSATLRLPSDREIVSTRVFDAPRRLVFEAWTRPEHLAPWWGPIGKMKIAGGYELKMQVRSRGKVIIKWLV
jgi:uncharacterized protein YndB with AHSA1/START domain